MAFVTPSINLTSNTMGSIILNMSMIPLISKVVPDVLPMTPEIAFKSVGNTNINTSIFSISVSPNSSRPPNAENRPVNSCMINSTGNNVVNKSNKGCIVLVSIPAIEPKALNLSVFSYCFRLRRGSHTSASSISPDLFQSFLIASLRTIVFFTEDEEMADAVFQSFLIASLYEIYCK